MRILLVNVYAYVTGGADVHCLELGRGLRERGHEVALLATESPRNEEREGLFIPASVTHASRDGLPSTARVKAALMAFWNPDAARAMKRLLSDFQPDVVHVHKVYPQLSVAPVVLASRAGVPVVQTLHDYELMSANATDDGGGWRDRNETQLTYRMLNTATRPIRLHVHAPRVSTFIAVSGFVARAHASHGIRATVLPNFVTATVPADEHVPFVARDGVVYSGRLRAEKGIEHVLELARRLPNIPVRIAGWGALADHVAAQARSLPNLHFLGRLSSDAVRTTIRTSRLAVVPSLWSEPGGLAVLEAMVEGTPVVVYDVGGVAEYVADAEAGAVVAPNVDALASACAALYDDARAWDTLSLNARRGIEHTHSPDTYMIHLERIYDEALSRQST